MARKFMSLCNVKTRNIMWSWNYNKETSHKTQRITLGQLTEKLNKMLTWRKQKLYEQNYPAVSKLPQSNDYCIQLCFVSKYRKKTLFLGFILQAITVTILPIYCSVWSAHYHRNYNPCSLCVVRLTCIWRS